MTPRVCNPAGTNTLTEYLSGAGDIRRAIHRVQHIVGKTQVEVYSASAGK